MDQRYSEVFILFLVMLIIEFILFSQKPMRHLSVIVISMLMSRGIIPTRKWNKKSHPRRKGENHRKYVPFCPCAMARSTTERTTSKRADCITQRSWHIQIDNIKPAKYIISMNIKHTLTFFDSSGLLKKLKGVYCNC